MEKTYHIFYTNAFGKNTVFKTGNREFAKRFCHHLKGQGVEYSFYYKFNNGTKLIKMED